MYSIGDFIEQYDSDYEIKHSIADNLINNTSKEFRIDLLVDDLQIKLYDYIFESEDLDIDDGSNVERDFRNEIKRILEQYFK